MKAVIKIDAYPDELVRGECLLFIRHEDKTDRMKITSYGLIVCCPKCGRASSGPHVYDPETKTLHPSLVCNSVTDGIKCDYHGWLKNGVFSEI